MAEAVGLAAFLPGGDHPLGAGQGHAHGNLDQRVLAGGQALDRLRFMLLAGAADDHGIHGGIGQRFIQRQRPFLVAERSANSFAASGRRPTTVSQAALPRLLDALLA